MDWRGVLLVSIFMLFIVFHIPAYSAFFHVSIQTAGNTLKFRLTVLLTILIVVFFKLHHLKVNNNDLAVARYGNEHKMRWV